MTRDQVLTLLELPSTATSDVALAQLQKRRAETVERMERAPVAALRAKYEQQLNALDLAREVLVNGGPAAATGPSAVSAAAGQVVALGGVPARATPVPATTPVVPGAAASAPRPAAVVPAPRPVAGLTDTMLGDLPAAMPLRATPSPDLGADALDLEEGQLLLDRYEIRRELGRGGMGAVYAAFDQLRREEVAIKVMHPMLMASEGARDRFASEALLATRLSNDGLVRVYDMQRDRGRFFLTMELLRGETLRARIQREAERRLSVADTLALADQLCRTLSYVHENNAVHRDIKPENVFVSEKGAIKLLDFGLARVVGASNLTMTGAALGTAYYMAPEQLLNAAGVDGRADQYAVAVMLYECLAGHVPAGRAEPLRKLRKDVPARVSAAIDRAMDREPKRRFATMADFWAAVRPPASKRPLLAGAAAMVAVLAAAVGIWVWSQPAPLPEVTEGSVAVVAAEPLPDMTEAELAPIKSDAQARRSEWQSLRIEESAAAATARQAFARGEALEDDEDYAGAAAEFATAAAAWNEETLAYRELRRAMEFARSGAETSRAGYTDRLRQARATAPPWVAAAESTWARANTQQDTGDIAGATRSFRTVQGMYEHEPQSVALAQHLSEMAEATANRCRQSRCYVRRLRGCAADCTVTAPPRPPSSAQRPPGSSATSTPATSTPETPPSGSSRVTPAQCRDSCDQRHGAGTSGWRACRRQCG
jgi:hypothetical protein